MAKRRAVVRQKLDHLLGKQPLNPPHETIKRNTHIKAKKKKHFGGCRGGCPHYAWCNTHRTEDFPCENIKEEGSTHESV